VSAQRTPSKNAAMTARAMRSRFSTDLLLRQLDLGGGRLVLHAVEHLLDPRVDLVVHDDPLLSGDEVEVDVRPEHRARARELIDRRLVVDAPGPRPRVPAVWLVVVARIPARQVAELRVERRQAEHLVPLTAVAVEATT